MKRRTMTFVAMALLGAGSVMGGSLLRDRMQGGAINWTDSTTHFALLAQNKDENGRDLDIPEGDYFTKIIELLQQHYVEPFPVDMKLAAGAVKGMINSLQDPLANTMSKEQFSAFVEAQAGKFQGIGVEVKFDFSKKAIDYLRKSQASADAPLDAADLIPNVIVTAVLPASPAAKAGIQPGDQILVVNQKTVLSTQMVEELRKAVEETRKDSKLSDEQMNQALRKIQDQFSDSTSPAKVRDVLMLGKTGTVAVTWRRGKETKSATIGKEVMSWPAVQVTPNAIELRLFSGAANQLAQAIQPGKPIRIDLRNSTQGNFDQLVPVLGVLAGAQKFGSIVAEGRKTTLPLESTGKLTGKLDLTLIVDSTTRGAAEILAEALKSKGLAKIEGSASAGELAVIKTVVLPDGSGYTLPIGTFVPGSETEVAKR